MTIVDLQYLAKARGVGNMMVCATCRRNHTHECPGPGFRTHDNPLPGCDRYVVDRRRIAILPDTLRGIMDRNGLTPHELARICRVGVQEIERMTRGIDPVPVDPHVLMRLVNATGIAWHWLADAMEVHHGYSQGVVWEG